MRSSIAILVAGLLLATPAAAQQACSAALAGPGTPLTFREPLGEPARAALSAAVFLALSDDGGRADATLQAIEDAAPCPISSFDVAGVTWRIAGATAPAPARYAHATGVETYYYLMWGPSLGDAGAWAVTRRGGRAAGPGGPHAYLVGVADELHFVFRIYDGAPDGRRLADDLAAIIAGGIPPLAAYDPEGDAVTIAAETESGVTGELFRPVLLEGERNAVLLGPDGHLFAVHPAGVRMLGSEQVCAEAYGPLERTRLNVLDPRPQSLDLGCSFEGEGALVSLFSTRRPAQVDDKAYFRTQIRAAQADNGVRKRIPVRPQRPPGLLRAGEVWTDKDETGQGLWFFRRGDFVIEFRATFRLDSTDIVFDALEQVVRNAPARAAAAGGPG